MDIMDHSNKSNIKEVPEISVIIPVYNEEGNILQMYDRLKKVLTEKINVTYEIIYIDDGSVDKSWQIIKELDIKDNAVSGIKFSRNFGHQLAVSAGIDNAHGKATVIIDADLQDPPELIIDLYNKWKEGYEVVYAKRKKRTGENKFKLLTAFLFYRLLNKLTEIRIPLDTGDYRLFDYKVRKELIKLNESNRFIRGLISWIGFKQTSVEYDRDSRYYGSTKYSIRKMVQFGLDGITSFSLKPLKISQTFGIIAIFFGFCLSIYALIEKIFFPENVISGWASIFVTLVFFAGVQLLSIGILGEYIGRIFTEVKKRPLYIIDEKINN